MREIEPKNVQDPDHLLDILRAHQADIIHLRDRMNRTDIINFVALIAMAILIFVTNGRGL